MRLYELDFAPALTRKNRCGCGYGFGCYTPTQLHLPIPPYQLPIINLKYTYRKRDPRPLPAVTMKPKHLPLGQIDFYGTLGIGHLDMRAQSDVQPRQCLMRTGL